MFDFVHVQHLHAMGKVCIAGMYINWRQSEHTDRNVEL